MLLDDLYKQHKKGFLKQKSFKQVFDIHKYPLQFDSNQLVSLHPENRDDTYKKLIETFDFKFIDQSIISFILNSYQNALMMFAKRNDSTDIMSEIIEQDHRDSIMKVYKYSTQYFKNDFSSIDKKFGVTYLGIQNQLLFDKNGCYTKQIIRFQAKEHFKTISNHLIPSNPIQYFKYMLMSIIFRGDQITIEYPKEMHIPDATYSTTVFNDDFKNVLNFAIHAGMYHYTFGNVLENLTGLNIPYTKDSHLFVRLVSDIQLWQNGEKYTHLVQFIKSLSNKLEVNEYIKLIKEYMVVVDMMTI